MYWSYYPHRSRELVSPVCGIVLCCFQSYNRLYCTGLGHSKFQKTFKFHGWLKFFGEFCECVYLPNGEIALGKRLPPACKEGLFLWVSIKKEMPVKSEYLGHCGLTVFTRPGVARAALKTALQLSN